MVTSLSKNTDQITESAVDQDTDITFTAQGEYTVQFVPFSTGAVMVTCSLLDDALVDPNTGGLPYSAPVLSGPAVAHQSVALGRAASRGTARGNPGRFLIQARDEYGFDLTQAAAGSFQAVFRNTVPLNATVTTTDVTATEGVYQVRRGCACQRRRAQARRRTVRSTRTV